MSNVDSLRAHLVFIIVVACLSFWRVWLVDDTIWDDNCWVVSIYSTDGLGDFLRTGLDMSGRPIVGVQLYALFWLHKNTEYFYIIAQTIAFGTQLATALLLYTFVRALVDNAGRLALFVSVAFVAVHLDQSLPYYSTLLNYRLGLPFAVASFYFTVRAFKGPQYCGRSLTWAVLCAFISHTVLIEVAVMLEPARFAMIWWLNRPYSMEKQTWQWNRSLKGFAPFVIATIPIVLHRLTAKPYGIYEGLYRGDFRNLLDVGARTNELWDLLIRDWLSFWRLAKYAEVGTFVTGLVAALIVLLYVRLLCFSSSSARDFDSAQVTNNHYLSWLISDRALWVYFSCLLFFPTVFLYQYLGLALYLKGTQNNAHTIFTQFGYALFVGGVLNSLCQASVNKSVQRYVFVYFASALLALGVFNNNVGIDLYLDSWKRQSQFWRVFINRFPTLPKRADFLFDVYDGAYPGISDLRVPCDFESQINLLYATSTSTTDFRSYRVLNLEQVSGILKKRSIPKLDHEPIERMSHWGMDILNPDEVVVVLYRPGIILVGEEIRKGILGSEHLPYDKWLDNSLSEPGDLGTYFFRNKMRGLNQ